MIPAIWYRWLLVVIIGLMIFGTTMVLVPDLTRQIFSLLLYADARQLGAGVGAPTTTYIMLVHGVLGAVIVGWGASMLLAVIGPFKRAQREGWLLLAIPLAVWFVPDTVFSVYTGFWQNAAFNAAVAAAFAVPLVATRHLFWPSPNR